MLHIGEENLARIIIYSMYRRRVLRYMYQGRQSGWHYFIGRKNSRG